MRAALVALGLVACGGNSTTIIHDYDPDAAPAACITDQELAAMRGHPIYDMRVDAAAVDAATRDAATTGKARAPVPVAETFPRRGPWTANNQLGIELPFSASVDHPQTLLKLDEWGFPEVWTISLGYRLDGDIPAGSAFDTLAEIEFGSGGITQQLVCDWTDGTVLSLPLNAVNIRARWAQALTGLPFPEGVRLSVMMARGPACSGARATRTLPAFVPAGGSSLVQPIPAFARSVRIIPADAAAAAVVYSAAFTFNFSANVSGVAGDGSIPGNFLGPDVSIPVPAFAHYFVMSSSGGAATAIPVFNLVGGQ